MLAALIASVTLGVVATLGDFVWAYFNVRHRPLYGLVHAAAFGLAIGAAVGARNGRIAVGALGGLIVLLVAGAFFYLLSPLMGMRGMFPAWMLFWVCFALVQRQMRYEMMSTAIVRGVAAAVLSGLAFYAISGIWTSRAPAGPNYLRNFGSWTFAFFPGFASLFTRSSSSADRRSGVT